MALLVPVGDRPGKPHSVLQPFMVLRTQSRPSAVLLVSSRHAYIRAISHSVLTVNGEACVERELVTGDRIGLGLLVYQFRYALPPVANGRAAVHGSLTVDESKTPIPIQRPIVLVGESEGADVRLTGGTGGTDVGVVLELEDEHVLVSLASPPAFRVNGAARTRHVLAEGDVIEVGGHSIRYSEHAPAAEPPPAAAKVVDPVEASAEVRESEVDALPPARESVAKPPRTVQKPAEHSDRLDERLKSWGPLARAVGSADAFFDMDAAADADEVEAPERGGRRRRWPLVVLIVILLVGVGALAWWLRGRV